MGFYVLFERQCSFTFMVMLKKALAYPTMFSVNLNINAYLE